jgi:hypothetical protein
VLLVVAVLVAVALEILVLAVLVMLVHLPHQKAIMVEMAAPLGMPVAVAVQAVL